MVGHQFRLKQTESKTQLAAALPQATSRRLLVKQMTRELLTAPDRVSVAKRGVLKVLRTPADADAPVVGLP